jgi:hypothetical protein
MLIFVLPAERKKRKRCTDEGVMDVLFVWLFELCDVLWLNRFKSDVDWLKCCMKFERSVLERCSAKSSRVNRITYLESKTKLRTEIDTPVTCSCLGPAHNSQFDSFWLCSLKKRNQINRYKLLDRFSEPKNTEFSWNFDGKTSRKF